MNRVKILDGSGGRDYRPTGIPVTAIYPK